MYVCEAHATVFEVHGYMNLLNCPEWQQNAFESVWKHVNARGNVNKRICSSLIIETLAI